MSDSPSRERLRKLVTDFLGDLLIDINAILYARIAALEAENAELRRQIAEHRCALPDTVQEALNTGDGSYRP